MSKKKKGIKPSELPKAAITAVVPPPADEIKVSFKHLDLKHSKFSVKERESAYFLKLLERFKEVCSLTELQIKTSHNKAMRCHTHEWKATSEPSGFGLKGQLGQCEGWQFQISSNEHGRVHGIFINDVFFVVWLDPEHALYP